MDFYYNKTMGVLIIKNKLLGSRDIDGKRYIGYYDEESTKGLSVYQLVYGYEVNSEDKAREIFENLSAEDLENYENARSGSMS